MGSRNENPGTDNFLRQEIGTQAPIAMLTTQGPHNCSLACPHKTQRHFLRQKTETEALIAMLATQGLNKCSLACPHRIQSHLVRQETGMESTDYCADHSGSVKTCSLACSLACLACAYPLLSMP
eukprot:1161622-Pelagomonas_calceolata.AAC.16